MTLFSQILLFSSLLVSGSPLKATQSEGVAPLRFELSNVSNMMGAAYVSNPEVCDLFVTASSIDGKHKGLYWCAFEEFGPDGTPIYAAPEKISQTPWAEKFGAVKICNVGTKVGAFTVSGGKIKYADYDHAKRSFSADYTTSISYDRGSEWPIVAWDVAVDSKGHTAEVVLLCSSRQEIVPKSEDKSDAIYNSGGLYMGQLSAGTLFRGVVDLRSGSVKEPFVQVGAENIMVMPSAVACVRTPDGALDGYVVGNKVGAMKYVPRSNPAEVTYLASESADVAKMPHTLGRLRAYGGGGYLIASGEGSHYIFRLAKADKSGAPTYKDAQIICMKGGLLYGGNLSVPTVVDWDADGADDIICGNAGGWLLFFKNYGTTASPAFGGGEPLCHNGKPLCIRAGYYELQGPQESGWGYTCPAVIDWDGNGTLDIICGYNEGKFLCIMNYGTPTQPKLDAPRIIMCDGMELYGAWRVRPAVCRIGADAYMAIMDEREALHIYRRSSDAVVADVGLLTLYNGMSITGYRANGTAPTFSERGREKLHFADWDGDGDLDLFVGTTKQASMPFVDNGLPWSYWQQTKKALNVLYFENVGTDSKLFFALPKLLQFKGEDMNIGTHSNAPSVCYFGSESGLPNLIVGNQSGNFYFFDRKDITMLNYFQQ